MRLSCLTAEPAAASSGEDCCAVTPAAEQPAAASVPDDMLRPLGMRRSSHASVDP